MSHPIIFSFSFDSNFHYMDIKYNTTWISFLADENNTTTTPQFSRNFGICMYNVLKDYLYVTGGSYSPKFEKLMFENVSVNGSVITYIPDNDFEIRKFNNFKS